MEDKDIIKMLESRDENAIEQIKKKYSSYLFTVAKNILGNVSDAEECVSETYLRAWLSIPPERPESLSRYLSSLIRNFALDTVRARKTSKRSKTEYLLSLDELDDLISPDGLPENEIEGELFRSYLTSFLRGLPENQRTVFIRRYYFFDPLKKIAVSCGMSVSSVKVSLFRTRAKLKEYLRKEGYNV